MKPEHRLIPVALSARHVHLSLRHVEELFGRGYALVPWFELSQPGQYAAHETVEVVGPKRSLSGVRVLGPPRGETQVELSITDGFVLGINVPTRLSGDILGTPGVHLIGPRGAVRLTQGCICAARHIHCSPEDARLLGIQDGQKVYVRLPGPRGVIFDQVIVRVSPSFRTELHVDTDEGNASGIRADERVEVIASLCRDLCGRENCSITKAVSDGLSRPFCDLAEQGVRFR